MKVSPGSGGVGFVWKVIVAKENEGVLDGSVAYLVIEYC